ncbi:MAG: hypothetical protein R2778_01270 [Saprospiraceae bacterium]
MRYRIIRTGSTHRYQWEGESGCRNQIYIHRNIYQGLNRQQQTLVQEPKKAPNVFGLFVTSFTISQKKQNIQYQYNRASKKSIFLTNDGVYKIRMGIRQEIPNQAIPRAISDQTAFRNGDLCLLHLITPSSALANSFTPDIQVSSLTSSNCGYMGPMAINPTMTTTICLRQVREYVFPAYSSMNTSIMQVTNNTLAVLRFDGVRSGAQTIRTER